MAAFFGLSAPLCAAACLALADPATAATHEAEPACHEAPASEPTGAPAPVPAGTAGSCCEFADQATAPMAEASWAASAAGVVAQTPSWQAPAVRHAWSTPVSVVNDLPPPDILLLKSTLIV